MTEKTTYICNGCGEEIVNGRSQTDYAIVVDNLVLPHRGSVSTLLHIEPPVRGGPYHFHNTKCLREYYG